MKLGKHGEPVPLQCHTKSLNCLNSYWKASLCWKGQLLTLHYIFVVYLFSDKTFKWKIGQSTRGKDGFKSDNCGGFLLIQKLDIVMNELRRFKHLTDFLANISHIIESAVISAS